MTYIYLCRMKENYSTGFSYEKPKLNITRKG